MRFDLINSTQAKSQDLLRGEGFHKLVMQHGLMAKGQNQDFNCHSSTKISTLVVIIQPKYNNFNTLPWVSNRKWVSYCMMIIYMSNQEL